MTKAQIEASLNFSAETLAQAEEIRQRIVAEPFPRRPYWQERLNYADKLIDEIKAHRSRLMEQLINA